MDTSWRIPGGGLTQIDPALDGVCKWQTAAERLKTRFSKETISLHSFPLRARLCPWFTRVCGASFTLSLCSHRLTPLSGTSLQFDPVHRVLYVMGSFKRLTATNTKCAGLAAFEVDSNEWTCLANEQHSVEASTEGSMLLTPFGLLVAGKAHEDSTWTSVELPYTIALLSASQRARRSERASDVTRGNATDFSWAWLPDFPGHYKPLHT